MRIRYLGWVIPLGMLAGPMLFNRELPFLFGMPFLLGWIALWTVLASVVLGFVFWLDPANSDPHDDELPPGKP